MSLDSWKSEDVAKIAEHLDFVADVELSSESYEFDLLRIYVRRHDGMLLWATDAGCSCPSPFEGESVADLRESTSATLLDTVMADFTSGYHSNPEAEVRKDISDAIREAVKRGAR